MPCIEFCETEENICDDNNIQCKQNEYSNHREMLCCDCIESVEYVCSIFVFVCVCVHIRYFSVCLFIFSKHSIDRWNRELAKLFVRLVFRFHKNIFPQKNQNSFTMWKLCDPNIILFICVCIYLFHLSYNTQNARQNGTMDRILS